MIQYLPGNSAAIKLHFRAPWVSTNAMIFWSSSSVHGPFTAEAFSPPLWPLILLYRLKHSELLYPCPKRSATRLQSISRTLSFSGSFSDFFFLSFLDRFRVESATFDFGFWFSMSTSSEYLCSLKSWSTIEISFSSLVTLKDSWAE